MKILESAENYLETILMLKKRTGLVRSIDIANSMNFSKPSISYAMKQFRENGLITMDAEGHIELTDEGLAIVARVFERHQMIAKMLMSMGVSEETAREDACKIEHDLSDETFLCIKAHYEQYLREAERNP